MITEQKKNYFCKDIIFLKLIDKLKAFPIKVSIGVCLFGVISERKMEAKCFFENNHAKMTRVVLKIRSNRNRALA